MKNRAFQKVYQKFLGFLIKNLFIIFILFSENDSIDHLIIASMFTFYNSYTTKNLLQSSIQLLKPYSSNNLSIIEDKWQNFISNKRNSVSFAYLFFTQLGALDCFINVIFCIQLFNN